MGFGLGLFYLKYLTTFLFMISSNNSVLCCVFASSVVNTSSDTKAVTPSETLLIGSGPLPARAPPEKKPPVTTQSSEMPKIAAQPPPVSSAPAVVVTEPPPVKAVAPAPVPAPVPPPVKPVMSSTSLPKLTQPMPLASRPPLANIARGVAPAFLEQEDDDTETTDVKTLTGIPTSVTALAPAKKMEAIKSNSTKPPAPVPPPATSVVTTKSAVTKDDFVMGLSGMSYSDMVLAAQTQKTVSGLPYDRGDGKGLGLDHVKARAALSNRQPAAAFRSKWPGPLTDSRGRKKLEIGRNVM